MKIKLLRPGAKLPVFATPGAAGADLHACENICIRPGCRIVVATGLAMEIPEGMEVQIRPRSGLAAKFGVTVLNAPGTIDSDYRGEIGVMLVNLGVEPFYVETGDRIAQMVIGQVQQVKFEEVSDLSDTLRGTGGFGSTGVSS